MHFKSVMLLKIWHFLYLKLLLHYTNIYASTRKCFPLGINVRLQLIAKSSAKRERSFKQISKRLPTSFMKNLGPFGGNGAN